MKQRPNIMLISIDTLRADHLSCYGYHRETTPHIDRIAAEGIRYTNAYSTAVWTPPAHASMLTGLYPAQHGVVDQNRLADDIPTIAEVLKHHGYHTAGFVNNSQVGELVGLDRGHDDFYEIWRGLQRKQVFKRALHKILELSGYADHGATETNRLIARWLAGKWNHDKPFYIFAHYIDAHNPLKAPHPFRFKYLDRNLRQQVDMKKIWRVADNPLICLTDGFQLNDIEREALAALYDEEISYLDHKIGELYRWLKDGGLLDNTLLVITADHGEHLGEHGLYSHVASLHEPVVHIPMILYYPAVVGTGIEREPFMQLTDILPTVLSAAQIDYQHGDLLAGKAWFHAHVQGSADRCVVGEWEGRVPYFVQRRLQENEAAVNIDWIRVPQTMIRDGRYKLILEHTSPRHLYDLVKDPQEEQNLVDQRPDIVRQLSEKLAEWQAEHPKRGVAPMYELEEVTKKNLEGLGYF